MLEAEIVTADGRIRTVSHWRDPELYFALKGGGGGTFGVVTRLTLKTHPLPSTIGAILFDITAKDNSSWRELVARMMGFYADKLCNPAWGEQIAFKPGRKLSVVMVCHSLSRDEIARTWAPFLDWVRGRAASYAFAADPAILALPTRDFFDPAHLLQYPGLVLRDDRPGAPADQIYWASNRGEAGQVLHAYQSAWLPMRLLAPARRRELVDALVRASSVWDVSLHTNKGLGGGSAEAISATLQTATSPQAADAFALVICAAEEQPAWPGIPGHEPHVAEGRRDAAGVRRAMQPLLAIAPNTGAYISESDYFQRNWKQAYWGNNYPLLAAAKKRYDPLWLFKGHHCVEPV